MESPQAGGEVVQTFTVLTTEPSELCAPIHNRVPMIRGRENWPAWLEEVDVPQDKLLSMLRPYSSQLMRAYWAKALGVGTGTVHRVKREMVDVVT